MTAGPVGAAREAVRETASSTRLVFANPDLRRVNLALTGSMIGDWAFATAVTVFAYRYGGAPAVAAYGVVKLALTALTLPFGSVLADRWPARPFLIALDLVRAVIIAVATVLVWTGGSGLAVLVLAVAAGFVGAPFRPAQAALLPALARSPRELTATNAVSSTIESLSFMIGPALAGLLLTVTDEGPVFALNVVTFLWSALLLSRLGGERAQPEPDDGEPAAEESFLAEVAAGFVAVREDRRLRLVVALTAGQTFVMGASRIFAVVAAVEVLRRGPEALGFLDAVVGVGAILGGLVALSRSAGGSVARDFGVGVFGWAVPFLILALWPSPVVALAAFAVVGLANPLVDVNLMTVLQRIAPAQVLGRVFGAVDTVLLAAAALGALVGPLLVDPIGLRWTLVVVCAPVAVLALVAYPALARLDREQSVPVTLGLVHRQPVFAPLPPPVQETLARRLTERAVPAGTVVVAEGEAGEQFFLIASGQLEAVRGAETLSEMGVGDCFGEIALLRDVPRTATVVAVTDAVLHSLDRADFLDALGASAEATQAADLLVVGRLAR